MAWADYEIEIVPYLDERLDTQWYWHVYYKGTKINGGTAPFEHEARIRAGTVRSDHDGKVFRSLHVWDENTHDWVTRESLGLPVEEIEL